MPSGSPTASPPSPGLVHRRPALGALHRGGSCWCARRRTWG